VKIQVEQLTPFSHVRIQIGKYGYPTPRSRLDASRACSPVLPSDRQRHPALARATTSPSRCRRPFPSPRPTRSRSSGPPSHVTPPRAGERRHWAPTGRAVRLPPPGRPAASRVRPLQISRASTGFGKDRKGGYSANWSVPLCNLRWRWLEIPKRPTASNISQLKGTARIFNS